jgi:hypothetical protein
MIASKFWLGPPLCEAYAAMVESVRPLSYLGPGGLDSVFYLPCTVQSLGRISNWQVGIVSHRKRKIVELAR